MRPEKNQEYFSDGLAEEILNRLAKIPRLRVVARTSSFQFKGKTGDLRSVGETLNASAILEGSVRKQGNRVRVTAQLIKVADGFHLWSDTYDRELTDIFAVQDDIAKAVAAALQVTLLGSASAAPAAPQKNVEAYNAVLQGRYFRDRGGKENLEKAAGHFEQALKLDPNYAVAWAGLADVRDLQARFAYVPPGRGVPSGAGGGGPGARPRWEPRRRARPDRLDKDNLRLGLGRRRGVAAAGACVGARKRARSSEPGPARLQPWSIRRGPAAGPPRGRDRPSEFGKLEWSGTAGILRWEIRGGRSARKKSLELSPERPASHANLGVIAVLQGRPQEALAEIQKEADALWRLHGLAIAHHALKDNKQADEALTELIAGFKDVAAYQIAAVYAFRGEADRAFEWLERAYAQRDGGLTRREG